MTHEPLKLWIGDAIPPWNAFTDLLLTGDKAVDEPRGDGGCNGVNNDRVELEAEDS